MNEGLCRVGSHLEVLGVHLGSGAQLDVVSYKFHGRNDESLNDGGRRSRKRKKKAESARYDLGIPASKVGKGKRQDFLLIPRLILSRLRRLSW